MFSFFVRVFLVIFALWIVRRVLGMLFGEPRKQPRPEGKEVKGAGNKMVRDPVCGMYLDPRLGVRLDQKKEILYFCSDECRRKYLA